MSRQGGTNEMDAVLRYLERRAARLVGLIDAASQASDDKKIRDGGAQLVERIVELVEELRELQKAEDDGLPEAADVFHRRLYLAEKKVDTWNIPESVKKRLGNKPKDSAEAAPRRRRASRKKAA